MDLKTGIITGMVITLSVAVAIILAEKYQQQQLAKGNASAQNG